MNPKHIKSIAWVISVIMLLALLAGLTPGAITPAYAAPGDITRVSVDSSGTQANAGSFRSQISADGRYVAFVSDATNLIPDDTNNAEDVFVKDRQTGATTRVSVASLTGAEANNGSGAAAISGDGRYVAFYSDASNLVSGDTNGVGDIFVHDRQTGLTTRVSVDSSGNEANGENSDRYMAISGDGRYVAFSSEATNLINGDTNNGGDIFVHDRQTGQTRRVSVASNGAEANGNSSAVDISDDGRCVVFSSSATNLVAGDTNGKRDTFVYDLQTGGITRISVNTSGEQADGGGGSPAISGDGRYVVFLSASGNLDPRADEYINKDLVYVHDRQIGQTTLASVSSDGVILTVGLFDQPTISSNGRYVAFSFYDKGDNNGIMHIWVRDLQTGESKSVEGGNASSFGSSLSADGKIVAFWSSASNLVSGDTNEAADIFVREVVYGPERSPTVASVTPDCGFSTPICPFPSHASVSFIVIFSEPVTGVGVDDFSLDMIEGITGASITGVSGYGIEYFVTVDTGTGDGKLRLNVIDNDSIKDTALNPLGGVGAGNGDFTNFSRFLYLIDKNLPVVTSIVRADPSPTAAAEVRFTVTFSEMVWPVRPDDFVLSTTGSISGASVTAISPREDEYIGSATYTVTVNTGSGNGTLRLDLIDDDTIYDWDSPPPLGGTGIGNGNFTTGEAYTIDKNLPSVPSVTSSLRADANPTDAASVNFTVIFSEAVSGVDPGDFMIATTGNISDTIINDLSGSANTYTVTVVTGSGSGTLRLDLVDNDSILNSVNQPLGGLGAGNGNFTTGEVYTINKIPAPVDSLMRVSVDSSGAQANGASRDSQISGNGRYVAFESAATNLVPDDTNNVQDIFVKDRQTGATTRVSIASLTGAQANSDSGGVAISNDGRYVAFESGAANLVSVDTNGQSDVFVRDRETGVTTLVSVDSAGIQANDISENISISGDGHFIAFTSKATNLVSGDTNAAQDILVHDLQTGATTLVSVDSVGVQGNNSSYAPTISANGRYVVFSSQSTNLVSGDTNSAQDVFVHDLQTGQTTLVSVNSSGVQADKGATDPSISGDGRYVTFSSSAYNLMSVDTQGFEYVYVHDLQSGTTSVVLHDGYLMYGWAEGSVISADGRYIAFSYDDKGDGEAVRWIYIHDRVSDITVLPTSGGDTNAPVLPSLSADGLYLSYNSKSPSLVPDDTNGVDDVFVKQVTYPPELNPTVSSVGNSCPEGCGPADPVVYFTVNFSESVTGVDPSDFSLTTTGDITGATITSVSGYGKQYTVSVNTGSGNGTLRLDVLDDDSIKDFQQNPLGGTGISNGNFTSGEVYAVQKDFPVVTGIARADANPAVSGSVNFSVAFSEDVSGVDASDFALGITGNISGAVVAEVSGSGKNYTVKVNTGTGDGTLRLDLIDNDSILGSANQPLGGLGAGNGSFTTGEVYTITIAPTILSAAYRSTGSSDGWVLESSENSNVGGSKNSNASTFKLGDDAQDRQFRSVLHFPTYYLPDNAVVTQVILMIKKQDVIGTDPFTTHQNISVDIRKGYFSNFNLFSFGSLQPQDFQATADMYMVGTIQNNPVSGWYWTLLDSRAFPYINLTDVTQLRLGFQLDDNDDMGNDYTRFYSGDYDAQKDRPHLLIEYYLQR